MLWLMLVLLSISSKSCAARTDAALAGRNKREICLTSGLYWLHRVFQPSFLQAAWHDYPIEKGCSVLAGAAAAVHSKPKSVACTAVASAG